jgi:hypothetical protein
LRLLRGGERDGLPVEQDLAGILPVVAGQDLDHGRFAGAVLTDQRMNLASLDHKLGCAQRWYAGEALVDALHGEKRRHESSGDVFSPTRKALPAHAGSAMMFSTRRR